MSFLTRTKRAAPSAPATGKALQYVDASGVTHELDANGVDNVLTNTSRFNWVRNSGFWFAQRQLPGTLTTYGGGTTRAITADGWGITCENASMQYIRTLTAPAPETGLQGGAYGSFTKITSAGKLHISQVIETLDVANLRGRTVRLQFWAKAIVGNPIAFRVGLISENNTSNPATTGSNTFSTFNGAGTDPTLATSTANWAYLTPKTVTGDNCTVSGSAADLSLTPLWQRFGLCFDVPSNCQGLMLAVWSNGQLAATNGIAISQVSLTDGFEIQAWSPQDQFREFLRCQRYYCKSFGVDSAPAQNFGILGSLLRGHVSVAGATAGQPLGCLRFPVEMVGSPALTFYNPSAANAFARNTTAGTDATATAGSGTTAEGTTVTFTGIAAWTVAQAMAVHWTADAEL